MWLIKNNQKLRRLCKYFDIVTDIKKKRLVLRLDHGKFVMKIFESKLERRKQMGRPRLRWLEVERDIKR